jgi:hypothetical protein
LFGTVLVLFGLSGLYISQSEAAGTLGLVGFLLAFLGPALVVGVSWAEAFIAPFLAAEAPEFLETENFAFPLSLLTFVMGWLVFGVATLRARSTRARRPDHHPAKPARMTRQSYCAETPHGAAVDCCPMLQ